MIACVSALESRIVGQPVSGYGWRAPFGCEPRNRSPAIVPSIEVLLAKPFVAVSRIEETAFTLELHNTGDPVDMGEIRALVEHALSTGQEIGGCPSSARAKTRCGRSVTTLSSAHRTNTDFCDVFVT
jgi:hypothetical protein